MDNSITRLLAEVNEKNLPKYPLSLGNVIPEVPEPVQEGEHNTRIVLKAVPGRVYYNEAEVFYKRLNISEILTAPSIRSTDVFTPQLVVDMVNSQYALFLTLDDLEPFTVPEIALGESITLTITTRPESFGFIGSVEVEITNGKTLLQGVIGIRVLPIMSHPTNPLLGKYSGRMLTWGIDFTSLRPYFINTGVSKTAVNWPMWSAALTAMGIPAFNNGSLMDYSTADIPDSNQAFDRVSIQSLVASNEIVGPLYFHYNVLDGL